MNTNSRTIITIAFNLSWLLSSGMALAETFHNGGIGRCEGCHGKPSVSDELIIASSPASSPYMLKGLDASSTCLACHEAPSGQRQLENHHVATSGAMLSPGTAPFQLTPGGDFGWLKKNYRWRSAEGSREESSQGERHGHNIVAEEFGYSADRRNTTAPGGRYPATALACTSCHDPHGDYKRFSAGIVVERGNAVGGSGSYTSSPMATATRSVGTYRLLAGKGYAQKSSPEAAAFINDPPAAVSPTSYNRAETFANTRVAYGSGMSEWCRNCHPQIHGRTGDNSLGHPAGNGARMTGEIIANYNAYIASGNLNGASATSYNSMVPFEMGTDDYAVLKSAANSDGTNRKGADGESRVMCLTCHRAHASGWDSMTRWNMQSEFLVNNGKFPGIDNHAADFANGRTSQEVRKSFYDRNASDFASFQRSLCNKCHAKD